MKTLFAFTVALLFAASASAARMSPSKTIDITPGHCVSVGTVRVCAISSTKPAVPAAATTTTTTAPALGFATETQAEAAINALGAWGGYSFNSAFLYDGASCFGTYPYTPHHTASGEQTYSGFSCVLTIDPDGNGSHTFDINVSALANGTFSILPA